MLNRVLHGPVEEASDSTALKGPASSASGSVPTTTAGGAEHDPPTVEGIVSSVQARLDAKFAASDHPEGVLGPLELQCLDSGPVAPGDVFACVGTPRTEPEFALDPVGVVFYVIDESGKTFSIDGTDLPGTALSVAGPGMLGLGVGYLSARPFVPGRDLLICAPVWRAVRAERDWRDL